MDPLAKCYLVLGVKEGCTLEELKQAYRDLVKVWHPDRFTHNERLQGVAVEKLKEINGAYELLQARLFDPAAGGENAAEAPIPPEEPSAPAPQPYGMGMVLRLTLILALPIMLIAGLGGYYYKNFHKNSSGEAASAASPEMLNALTAKEKAAGWKLLFDGKDFSGWHTFKKKQVQAGWQVKDDTIACIDPKKAGDLVTVDEFSWFELELDYNISPRGNSGIMFHVSNEGKTTWATGPEFQLEDNNDSDDEQLSGWLYQLYRPPVDPKTGKPLDATKPAGEWNHVRLVVSPEKCEHYINGVKYFEYVLNSDDFKQRVAACKLGKRPGFAKYPTGFIALQGDHGKIAFRNIKIRVLEPAN